MTDIVDTLTQALSNGAVITGEDLAQRNNQGAIPKALLPVLQTDPGANLLPNGRDHCSRHHLQPLRSELLLSILGCFRQAL